MTSVLEHRVQKKGAEVALQAMLMASYWKVMFLSIDDFLKHSKQKNNTFS